MNNDIDISINQGQVYINNRDGKHLLSVHIAYLDGNVNLREITVHKYNMCGSSVKVARFINDEDVTKQSWAYMRVMRTDG